MGVCEQLRVVVNFGRCTLAEYLRYDVDAKKFVTDNTFWARLRFGLFVGLNIFFMFNNIHYISYVTWTDYDTQLAYYATEFGLTFLTLYILIVDSYFVQCSRCALLEALVDLDELYDSLGLDFETREVFKSSVHVQRWYNTIMAATLLFFVGFYFAGDIRKGISVKLLLLAYKWYKLNFHFNIMHLIVDKLELLVETIGKMTFAEACQLCQLGHCSSFATTCPLHCAMLTRQIYDRIEDTFNNAIGVAKHFHALSVLLALCESGVTFYGAIEFVLLHRQLHWENLTVAVILIIIVLVGGLVYLHSFRRIYEQSVKLALALQRICIRHPTSQEVKLDVERFSIRIHTNPIRVDCVTFDLSFPALLWVGHWTIVATTSFLCTGISVL